MSRVLRGMARDFPRTAPSGSLGARVMFFGHVEPDKWPLEELVRLRGRATSAHRVRRGRVSFDGFRQIAKSQILCGIANPGLIKIIYEPSEEGARARETQT